jgi:hypothetical protein
MGVNEVGVVDTNTLAPIEDALARQSLERQK